MIEFLLFGILLLLAAVPPWLFVIWIFVFLIFIGKTIKEEINAKKR